MAKVGSSKLLFRALGVLYGIWILLTFASDVLTSAVSTFLERQAKGGRISIRSLQVSFFPRLSFDLRGIAVLSPNGRNSVSASVVRLEIPWSALSKGGEVLVRMVEPEVYIADTPFWSIQQNLRDIDPSFEVVPASWQIPSSLQRDSTPSTGWSSRLEKIRMTVVIERASYSLVRPWGEPGVHFRQFNVKLENIHLNRPLQSEVVVTYSGPVFAVSKDVRLSAMMGEISVHGKMSVEASPGRIESIRLGGQVDLTDAQLLGGSLLEKKRGEPFSATIQGVLTGTRLTFESLNVKGQGVEVSSQGSIDLVNLRSPVLQLNLKSTIDFKGGSLKGLWSGANLRTESSGSVQVEFNYQDQEGRQRVQAEFNPLAVKSESFEPLQFFESFGIVPEWMTSNPLHRLALASLKTEGLVEFNGKAKWQTGMDQGVSDPFLIEGEFIASGLRQRLSLERNHAKGVQFTLQ